MWTQGQRGLSSGLSKGWKKVSFVYVGKVGKNAFERPFLLGKDDKRLALGHECGQLLCRARENARESHLTHFAV